MPTVRLWFSFAFTAFLMFIAFNFFGVIGAIVAFFAGMKVTEDWRKSENADEANRAIIEEHKMRKRERAGR